MKGKQIPHVSNHRLRNTNPHGLVTRAIHTVPYTVYRIKYARRACVYSSPIHRLAPFLYICRAFGKNGVNSVWPACRFVWHKRMRRCLKEPFQSILMRQLYKQMLFWVNSCSGSMSVKAKAKEKCTKVLNRFWCNYFHT